MKKALTVAAKELQEWAINHDELPTMDLLYVFFLKVAQMIHDWNEMYG